MSSDQFSNEVSSGSTRTKKLLILSSEFPPGPGGIGTHAHQLASHLHPAWDVTVVTPQDYASDGEIAEFNASQAFDVVRLEHRPVSVLEGVSRGRVLSKVIADRAPDVVLASGRRSVWLASVVCMRSRCRWVAIGHGSEFAQSPSWDKALTRWAFERAEAVVSVSRYTRDQMHRVGIRPKTDYVVPNGAEASRFRPLPQAAIRDEVQHLGLEQSRILITVGRVSERKGQDIVIRALPEVLRHVPRAFYLAVGLREKEAEFTNLARRLGVASHVRFVGRVGAERIVQLLNCSDIFVMTSRITDAGEFEGYGIAVIEAALCGIPAIVANAAGLAETVDDGVTGRHVPEDDPEATAKAIVALLKDDATRQRLGHEARRIALEERTWERRADQYDEVLRAVCREAPRTNEFRRAS